MKLPDRYRLSPTWLYTVLAAVGAVVIAGAVMLGGAVSRANAQDVLDRTLSYMKRQCDNYDNVIDADEVKSLMRLTEQADAILATSFRRGHRPKWRTFWTAMGQARG